uniref:Alpha-type protein kinase domain-containing protein n=1 Tax=Heterorhabditis bacteriophora TaxID=37862 RepID=A0A1I7WY67_HETBA
MTTYNCISHPMHPVPSQLQKAITHGSPFEVEKFGGKTRRERTILAVESEGVEQEAEKELLVVEASSFDDSSPILKMSSSSLMYFFYCFTVFIKISSLIQFHRYLVAFLLQAYDLRVCFNITLRSFVLIVKINLKIFLIEYFIVSLSTRLVIYDIMNLRELRSIKTVQPPEGCAPSIALNGEFLAYADFKLNPDVQSCGGIGSESDETIVFFFNYTCDHLCTLLLVRYFSIIVIPQRVRTHSGPSLVTKSFITEIIYIYI